MTSGGEIAARPPRIPKLAYRNRLPADQSSLSSLSQNTSASETQSSDTLTEPLLFTPSFSATASSIRPSFYSRSTASFTSLASNDSSSKGSSKASKKKKTNGVLGFLTLKEPSQIALEQYAESQRREAAAKGGTASPVVQGVSPQKLPANVPKVNSKWDGFPESLKSSRNSMPSCKRGSSSSQGSRPLPSYSYNTSVSSFASDGSRGSPNSLASTASPSTDTAQRRDCGPSETPSLSSASACSLPEITYFFPENPDPTGASSPAQHPWSPPPLPSHVSLKPASPATTSQDESTDMESGSPRSASDSSLDTSVNSKADAIFKKLKDGARFVAGEAQDVNLEEYGDPDAVPETHDFLSEKPATESSVARPLRSASPPMVDSTTRRPTVNFSRPRQSPQSVPHRLAFSALPTLYEASVASMDTIAGLPDLETKDSDTASIVPSVAPSEMSASWYRSPRERLGLGGRIRKNDVLPWEGLEEAPGETISPAALPLPELLPPETSADTGTST